VNLMRVFKRSCYALRRASNLAADTDAMRHIRWLGCPKRSAIAHAVGAQAMPRPDTWIKTKIPSAASRLCQRASPIGGPLRSASKRLVAPPNTGDISATMANDLNATVAGAPDTGRQIKTCRPGRACYVNS
jgi:hypothetical protein